jgi:5-methylcytosine-specific restriction endonuclease McrA
MPKYEPNLSARRVHANFARTLREAEQAQRNLVLWFADIYRRKLYVELGYTSIYAYTAERHGFSRRRCSAFIRLAESLTDLPVLHRSLAAGDMPWTKAREIVRVATRENEHAWVEEAKRSSRRSLERKIATVRGRVREARGPGRAQEKLALAASVDGSDAAAPGRSAGPAPGPGVSVAAGRGAAAPVADGGPQDGAESGGPTDTDRIPTRGRSEGAWAGDPAALVRTLPEEVRLRFSALQYAEYGALVERLRKDGWKDPVEDLIVAGLAALLEQGRNRSSGTVRPVSPETGCRRPTGTGPRVPGSARALRDESAGGDGSPAGTGSSGALRPGAVGLPSDPAPGATGSPPARLPEAGSGPPLRTYQVVVRRCPDCGNGEVLTGRGAKPLRPSELESVLCDARVHRPGKHNRATIPPAIRRAVLERDGHRCRVAGCGSTRFLAVHHREPRSAGGANTIENLVTLCARCHRAIHDMGGPARRHAEGLFARNGAARPAPGAPGGAPSSRVGTEPPG